MPGAGAVCSCTGLWYHTSKHRGRLSHLFPFYFSPPAKKQSRSARKPFGFAHPIQVFGSFQLYGSLRCRSWSEKQLEARRHPEQAARVPPASAKPFYLFSHGAIAFEEILAHFSLPGDVDVAVGAVAVAADPLQEVGAHRHLQGREDDKPVSAAPKLLGDPDPFRRPALK